MCEADEPEQCAADCNPYAEVPVDWLCPEEFYVDRLGCDCDCGAWDPDCEDPAQLIFNCEEGQLCGPGGVCGGQLGAVRTATASLPDEGCSMRRGSQSGWSPALLALGLLLLACRRRGPGAP